jgi:hypothetical protein
MSGCGGGTSETPVAATATPLASETPVAATATPSASPSISGETWGPATLVVVIEKCFLSVGEVTNEPDGVSSHQRGGQVGCSDEASDPRVSGMLSGTFEADGWNVSGGLTPDAFAEWGVLRLENAGGTWEGTYTGAFTRETGDLITVWLTGTGAYDGLTYYQFVRAAPGTVASGYQFYGFIYPGSPPNP